MEHLTEFKKHLKRMMILHKFQGIEQRSSKRVHALL